MNASVAHRHGFRRLCMMVDLEGYSRRDGPGQEGAQLALAEALDTAAAASGLRRNTWFRQDSGDGELAVLPAEEPEAVLVSAFPAAFDDALRRIHRRDGLLLRTRIAVHHGVAHPAAKGYAGAGVVEVARIVGADPVRRALASVPEARVVLALSQQVYSDAVVQGYSALQPSHFRRVGIADNEFRGTAWLAIPGVDPSRMRVDEPEP